MFYVTNLDGSQFEPLINIGTDFKMEQSVNGTFIVSFSVFPSPQNTGYDLLQSESIVTMEGYDFKVKQYSSTDYSKKITAVSTFFEHSKTRVNGVFSGSHTLVNHLAFALDGTGWTYTVDSSIANQANYISDFGDDNVISLVDKICKYHECEYVILPNNQLYFAKEIGADNDHQYRYKHNISDVVLVEDSTNLYTFIRGYGADGLEVSYTSPNADIFGFLEAEPISDERFTDANALGNYIKNSITDVPELAIESKIPELTNREIGERVWLIYEPLNIEMQTRILQQTKSLINGDLITSSVVFGNTQVKSSVDLFVEQKQAIDETNKLVVKAKGEYRSKFEQTDSRITLEVEQIETSIATIDVKANEIAMSVVDVKNELSSTITQTATSIRSEVVDVKNGLQSSIEQTATSIRSEVSAEITNVNGNVQTVKNDVSTLQQTASSLQSTVSSQETSISNHSSRISSAESRITQHANQISSKVSQTDYNGNTIASLINQTATTVSINASKINLVGAVSVLSDISGNLGTITAGTINVGTNMTVGTTLQIGQNWQSNLAKAIRFAGSSGSAGISYNTGSLTVSAVDKIRLSADTIEFAGVTTGITAVFG